MSVNNYSKRLSMILAKFIKLMVALMAASHGVSATSRGKSSNSGCDVPRSLSCSNYVLVYGESTTATVNWLLLEAHDTMEDRARCINELSRHYESHTLYLEGEEANQPVSCSLVPYLEHKSGRDCKGWDDSKANIALKDVPSIKNAGEAGGDMQIIQWIESVYKEELKVSKQPSDKAKNNFKKDLKEMIKILKAQNFKSGKFKKLEEAQPKVIARVIKNIKLIIKYSENSTPDAAFKAAIKAKGDATVVSNVPYEDHQTIVKLNQIRDQKLLSLFKTKNKNNPKFFIAGADHVLNENDGVVDPRFKSIVDKNPKRTAILKHRNVRHNQRYR